MSTFSNRRRGQHGHGGITEINVMPLVDLLLQLFIAVVIFFPVVEYGMGIDLPKGTTDTIKQEQTRTLTVDRAGRVAAVPCSCGSHRRVAGGTHRSRGLTCRAGFRHTPGG